MSQLYEYDYDIYINKQNAKETYYCTEKDFKELKFIRRPLKYKREEHLYLIKEFENKLIENYYSGKKKKRETMLDIVIDKLKIKKESRIKARENNKAKKEINRENEVSRTINVKNRDHELIKNYIKDGGNLDTITASIRREDALKKALKERGLTLRSDSRLCSEYIESGEIELEEVVEIMAEMDWLFKNTDYKNIMENEMGKQLKIAEQQRYDYGYYERQDINDIRDKASRLSKDNALKKWLQCETQIDDLPILILNRIEKIKINNKPKIDSKLDKVIKFVENERKKYDSINFKEIVKITAEFLIKSKNENETFINCYNYVMIAINKSEKSNGKCGKCFKNVYASDCINKKCGKCCNDVICIRHKYKLDNVITDDE